MINVGIIDPDSLTRTVVRTLLTDQDQELISISFAVDKLPTVQAIDGLAAPNLVLLDFVNHTPKLIKRVKSFFPKTSILVLSDFWKLDTVYEALRNGAVSYLRKATCLNNVLSAVVATYNGGSVLSPCISREIIRKLYAVKSHEDMLSARELQVANGIVDGLSYKMVAHHCGISLDTVRVYIKRIYRKLDINSKGELISQLKG